MASTTKDIVRSLDRLITHRRRNEVFDDFLAITDATLRMLPTHIRLVAETGKMAEDDAETAALWTRLREQAKYDDEDFSHFAAAYGALLEGSETNGEPDYKDALGELYMAWANPNSHSGQFFTPWPICQVMARLTLPNAVEELAKRITAAIGVDWSELGMDPTRPATLERIAVRHLPAHFDRFDPITVHDPAVGSGGTLLALAEIMPQWAVRMGLVQFYGQDIDHTCVLMCRINMMLYGLNGYSLRLTDAARLFAPDEAPTEPDILVQDGQLALFGEVPRKVA